MKSDAYGEVATWHLFSLTLNLVFLPLCPGAQRNNGSIGPFASLSNQSRPPNRWLHVLGCLIMFRLTDSPYSGWSLMVSATWFTSYLQRRIGSHAKFDQEDRILATERVQLAAAADRGFGYGIRTDVLPEEAVVPIDQCRHSFCR